MNIKFIFKHRSLKSDFKKLEHWLAISEKSIPINWKYLGLFVLSLIISLVTTILLFQTKMQREAVYMSGIFVFSALLWATEALPLFATSIIIFGLEILLLANPGNWNQFGFESGNSPSYQEILNPLSNPILVLFFGGFILAHAAVKEGVDKNFSGIVLKLFGKKPFYILFGLMSLTTVFSMWMSNTATTAMMITLVVPMLNQMEKTNSLRKAFVLAIPVAANIGGLGTPIASPPNAVAIGFLKNNGVHINFFEWMMIAFPFLIALLFFSWLLLWFTYKPKTSDITIKIKKTKLSKQGWFVVIIFFITVILWLTEELHHLPSAVVALMPAIAFTSTGMLERKDINTLEWHILLLIAGGIALGVGMQKTGLDQLIISQLPKNVSLILTVLVIVTIVFSTFMSNTAAANLLLPIGISFAIISHQQMASIGICIALSASLAMALPVSTPPNAIAYSKGELTTKDFIKIGSTISIFGIILIILFGPLIIKFWLN